MTPDWLAGLAIFLAALSGLAAVGDWWQRRRDARDARNRNQAHPWRDR